MANAINSLNFGNNTYTFTLPYASCSTAASTVAKTVTVSNFSLETGARIAVKFTVTNTASSPTLNVNSTGAKAIYYRGSAISAGYLASGRTYEFVYNGTQWELIGDINTDSNTTYSNATTSVAGLMSASDKSKLDAITASADSVSFSRSLSSGTKIGTITINGDATDLYCQTNTDTNTTYSAGTGISLSGTTFSNSGVRSIATGSTNGTISVNTNGTSAEVAVKGLGSAAYTASSAYATANHTHSYLPLSGGTLTGNLTMSDTKNIMLRTNETYLSGICYDTKGNECISLWAKNAVTRLRWNAGVDMSTMAAGKMMDITPDFEISKASGSAIGYIAGNTIIHSGNYTSYVTPANIGAATASHSHSGYASSSHTHSSYANQNAFSNVKVGSTTIAADTTTDTLELVGSNVTITPDATNDKVTIGITKANVTAALGYTPPTTNTTYSAATQSANGLMSAADKKKLDGIATGANNYTYTLPTASSSTLGGVKTTSTVTSTSGLTACPIISGVPYYKDTNTTYSAATTSAAGLMSASDKSKLDAITASADSVSFSRSLTSGTKIGTITINGTNTDLYAPSGGSTSLSGLGITASATELNYCDGVIHSLQKQLDNIAYGLAKVAIKSNTHQGRSLIELNGNTSQTLFTGLIPGSVYMLDLDGYTFSFIASNINRTVDLYDDIEFEEGTLTYGTSVSISNFEAADHYSGTYVTLYHIACL